MVAVVLGLTSQLSAWAAGAAYCWWAGKPFRLIEFCKWDCNWYASIARHGYDLLPRGGGAGDAANWGFFPLLPLVARLAHLAFGLDARASLLVTTGLLLPVCIVAFLRLLEAYRIGLDPWLAGSLVAFNPYTLYAHAGYSRRSILRCRLVRWLPCAADAGYAPGFLAAARPQPGWSASA
ncbi:MAG: hypothetical protein U1E53_10890 [Dongiaceae bacterium]